MSQLGEFIVFRDRKLSRRFSKRSRLETSVLDGGELFRDEGGSLFAGHHELKAFEISQVGALGFGCELFGPGSVLPLLQDFALLPGLLHRLLARVLRNFRDQIRKRNTLERNYLSCDTSQFHGTFDQALRTNRTVNTLCCGW